MPITRCEVKGLKRKRVSVHLQFCSMDITLARTIVQPALLPWCWSASTNLILWNCFIISAMIFIMIYLIIPHWGAFRLFATFRYFSQKLWQGPLNKHRCSVISQGGHCWIRTCAPGSTPFSVMPWPLPFIWKDAVCAGVATWAGTYVSQSEPVLELFPILEIKIPPP